MDRLETRVLGVRFLLPGRRTMPEVRRRWEKSSVSNPVEFDGWYVSWDGWIQMRMWWNLNCQKQCAPSFSFSICD